MPHGATSSKPFKPGTTGWSASDLDDPQIEARWLEGRYEIVEGVLTEMPAAYFSGAKRLYRLQFLISMHQQAANLAGSFANDVDMVIDESRVVRTDAVWMTPQDERRHEQVVANLASAGNPPRDPERMRLLVPPTLAIESVSLGHEVHDRRTKRKWYAEFGIPHYWVFDPFGHSIDCLVLEGGDYRTDASGRRGEVVRPSLFPGLALNLNDVWSA